MAPGAEALVAVSVRLDCTEPSAGLPRADLLGSLLAVPVNGREREVRIRVGSGNLVTDVAQTLCRVRPELRSAELSGPIG